MREKQIEDFMEFVRSQFPEYAEMVPLHDPRFIGNEQDYLLDCLKSNYVSSVGEYVSRFEDLCAAYTGSPYAIATVNGTAALHIALLLSQVRPDDEIITQPLTFIATANAIIYTGAKPVFLDVSRQTLGLSPDKMEEFLTKKTSPGKDGFRYNNKTKRRISACIPMHTFGFPAEIEKIAHICEKFNIALIEDAAESLGSLYNNKHTGLFGRFGILSFNGNKIITTGGGGMILTADKNLATEAKHITTQAKVPHPWEYVHDTIGYNYRLTNIHSALGCGQIESIEYFVNEKRRLAERYKLFLDSININYFVEPPCSRSNYWLNTIVLNDRDERDEFLKHTNTHGISTRPIWTLINTLPMFLDCECDDLSNSRWFQDRIVNIPSSVPVKDYYKDKKVKEINNGIA